MFKDANTNNCSRISTSLFHSHGLHCTCFCQKETWTDLLREARGGNSEAVKQLLKAKGNVNEQSKVRRGKGRGGVGARRGAIIT